MPRRAARASSAILLSRVWARSSVTLTEELLKPKWLVKSVLQDTGQVTLRPMQHRSPLLLSLYKALTLG